MKIKNLLILAVISLLLFSCENDEMNELTVGQDTTLKPRDEKSSGGTGGVILVPDVLL